MESEESRQGCAGHFLAAAQEDQKPFADTWNRACHLGSYFGGKQRKGVPGREITAEAKTQNDELKQNAAEPGEFSRLAISLQKINAEHVSESGEDHQVRRPTVHGADEPAEAHLSHDVLHAFEGVVGRGPIIKEQ